MLETLPTKSRLPRRPCGGGRLASPTARGRTPHRGLRRRVESSRRGVASAVGTMFTILIIAMLLADYLSVQFPQQMTLAEVQHTLLVENEFRELQGDVYAETLHPSSPVAVSTPINLGGAAVPPFGPGSTSSLFLPPPRAENESLALPTGGIEAFGGLSAQLQNRYTPQVSINFEEGAVIVGGPANTSTMLQGPRLLPVPAPGGKYYANLTLVNFLVQNLTQENGEGVVGVKTWIVSENTVFLPMSVPQYLNVSTDFVGAWRAWGLNQTSLVLSPPSISNCYVGYDQFTTCTVSIPITDVGIYLTVATVGLSFSP